ncbi:hypothetical protein AB0E11_10915 [Streptomyces fradiae]|uniref:hypothetical protein n=1 Tax=Streptomyces fradiae TaxID=1906 RepID=UPI0033F9AAAF
MRRPTGEHAPTDPPGAPRVDPRVLTALLGRHGWHRTGGGSGPYTRWTPPGPAAAPSLLVPTGLDLADSHDLLAEALTALARTTAPSARAVLTALATPSDEIHWHRAAPATAGPAPWAAQDRLRTAARRTLLAAARAAHGRTGPRRPAALPDRDLPDRDRADRDRAETPGAPPGRNLAETLPGQALPGPSLLDHVLLDHVLLTTPPGDAPALTAYLPVDPGRPVTERLHHALHATREAVDYQRATGRPDAFDTAVAAGVGRELTEALVALVHGTEGAAVTLAWAPATGAPVGCAARPEPVEFTPGDLPALREAGARYRRARSSAPARVTGTVVRLCRTGSRGPGTVRLRVLAGAGTTHLRATLDEDGYRTAVHAHLAGVPLRVHGRLEVRGGRHHLTGTHDVAAVHVDDAERDRLTKTLDEDG